MHGALEHRVAEVFGSCAAQGYIGLSQPSREQTFIQPNPGVPDIGMRSLVRSICAFVSGVVRRIFNCFAQSPEMDPADWAAIDDIDDAYDEALDILNELQEPTPMEATPSQPPAGDVFEDVFEDVFVEDKGTQMEVDEEDELTYDEGSEPEVEAPPTEVERLKAELAKMQATVVELKEGMAVLEDLSTERRAADAANRAAAASVRSLTPKDVVLPKFSGSDDVDGYVIQKKTLPAVAATLARLQVCPEVEQARPSASCG